MSSPFHCCQIACVIVDCCVPLLLTLLLPVHVIGLDLTPLFVFCDRCDWLDGDESVRLDSDDELPDSLLPDDSKPSSAPFTHAPATALLPPTGRICNYRAGHLHLAPVTSVD